MYRRIIAFLIIATMLHGCATPPPQYVLPSGIPYANITSAIDGAYDRHDSIDIYVTDKNGTSRGSKHLFAIAKSKNFPAGYVKVPANQPLTLSYSEAASGGRYCQISIEVSLEQGKNYSLVGGFEYEKGPIPIFTGTRKCRFGVKDDMTGMLIPWHTPSRGR